MTTGVIKYRVADFLKRFPPFSFFGEADLLELADKGRVRMHEDGDILYSEGEPQTLRVSIIRQGSVRLYQQRDDRAELVDMLGQGDLLGVGGLIGRVRHRASGKAVGDTIVYAFDVDAFRALCSRSTDARRFLSVYLALAPSLSIDVDEIDSGKTHMVDWMHEYGLRWDEPRCSAIGCSPDTPIREVGALMQDRNRDAAIVWDALRHPLGIVTIHSFLKSVATGQISVEEPISKLMHSPVYAIKPDFSVGSCLLEMLHNRCSHMCVTEDGTSKSAVLAVVSETNLMLHYGNSPFVLLREIESCESMKDLGDLRKRIDALVLGGLRGPEAVDWCCEVIGETHRSLVSRVIKLAAESVEAPKPDLDFTFLLVGSGGRSEILARNDLARILSYDEPEFGQEAAAEAYFSELANRVHDGLEACGFSEIFDMTEANRRWRQPDVVWQRLFSAWIREPLNEEIHKALAFFDFFPVCKEHPLAESLCHYIQREIRANKRFLPLIANEAMRELPPLSLVNGDAVNSEGQIEDKLRIKESVTQPIVEMARVFALHLGAMGVTNTVKRLELAAEKIPDGKEIFLGAARAFRVGLYFRAISGLRHANDGAIVEPSEFGRGDQILLKSCFPAVGKFQDYSAKYFGLRD